MTEEPEKIYVIGRSAARSRLLAQLFSLIVVMIVILMVLAPLILDAPHQLPIYAYTLFFGLPILGIIVAVNNYYFVKPRQVLLIYKNHVVYKPYSGAQVVRNSEIEQVKFQYPYAIIQLKNNATPFHLDLSYLSEDEQYPVVEYLEELSTKNAESLVYKNS